MVKQFTSSLIALLAIAGLEGMGSSVTNAQPGVGQCEPVMPGCGVGMGRRTLTVIGQGQVTAPADAALLEFRFSSRDQLAGDPLAPGLDIQATRRIATDALKPAIAALKSAGISDPNIILQTNSVQNPKLLVRVDKPTQEGLQQLVLAIENALRSNQNILLQSIGAIYTVRTCEPLERSARRIALKDAQRQLTTLGQDVGVQLGELLSVTVLPLVGSSASAACGSKIGIPASPFPLTTDESPTPYNPSDQPEIQVRSQVSVTHAIKDQGLNKIER